MTGQVIFRQAPPALRPLVHEAVEALGYFRPEAADQLVSIYEQLWPKGISATMLLSRGIDLAPLLSATGAADHRLAAEATTLRVIFNLRRQEFDANEPNWSTISSRVQFIARAQPEHHCARSMELNTLLLPRQDRFPLPMAGCDKEWCPCRWDMVMDE